MIKTIVIVVVLLVVAVGAVLAYAATKPATLRVQRTATIKAPPEKIFTLINDLRGWGAWSPYEKKDPAMKRAFSGQESGKGAVYEWDGDKNVGKGRMEITDVSAPSKIVIKLDFLRPFEAHNTASFTIEPKDGPNLFIGKVMSVFIDMDKMIGKDFEEGLGNIKRIAER